MRKTSSSFHLMSAGTNFCDFSEPKFITHPLSDTGLSGEETDDASENECYQNTEYSQFTEIKEQMYQVLALFVCEIALFVVGIIAFIQIY